jgi:hypothetical protein
MFDAPVKADSSEPVLEPTESARHRQLHPKFTTPREELYELAIVLAPPPGNSVIQSLAALRRLACDDVGRLALDGVAAAHGITHGLGTTDRA